MPGDISSQYLTALMLIGPYIARRVAIAVDDAAGVAAVPGDAPAAVMADFGHDARVDRRATTSTSAPAATSVATTRSSPTPTSAGYPLAAAAICGGRVEVPGLTDDVDAG